MSDTWSWDLPRYCDCDWCQAREWRLARRAVNKHSWSFYYFLKRAGDRPLLELTPDSLIITIKAPEAPAQGVLL